MVSIAGATSVGPLIEEYNRLGAAIAAAQTVIAAQGELQGVEAVVLAGGGHQVLQAAIPLSVADSATILNDMVAVWQAMQKTVGDQIAAIT